MRDNLQSTVEVFDLDKAALYLERIFLFYPPVNQIKVRAYAVH